MSPTRRQGFQISALALDSTDAAALGRGRLAATAESGLDGHVIAPKKLMLLTWKDRSAYTPADSNRNDRTGTPRARAVGLRASPHEQARDRVGPDNQAEDVPARDAACHTASQPGTNCVARSQARTRLSSRAMPWPAMSNAVPWSTDTRTTGSPMVMFTPASP